MTFTVRFTPFSYKASVLRKTAKRPSTKNADVISANSSSSHVEGERILPASVHHEQQAQLLKAALRQRRQWRKRFHLGSPFPKAVSTKKKVSLRRELVTPSSLKVKRLGLQRSLNKKILHINKTIQKTQAPNLQEEYTAEFIKRYKELLKLSKGSSRAVGAAKKTSHRYSSGISKILHSHCSSLQSSKKGQDT